MTDLNTTQIRNIRLKKNLSQEFVAFKLGVSQKAYSDLENGKTCLNYEKTKLLAEVLQTSIGKLCPVRCNYKEDSKVLH